MSVGTNIHRLRKERSISQNALAEAIGVHQTHISSIERGENLPSLQVAKKLAEFFGVSVDELLGESPALNEPAPEPA